MKATNPVQCRLEQSMYDEEEKEEEEEDQD